MKAMLINHLTCLEQNPVPLQLSRIDDPIPDKGQILIKVSVCGICHTELDEIEGRTPPPRLPIIPGHQVIGHVIQSGIGVSKFKVGDRVGVAWIFSTCGHCHFCQSGQENLCENFRATGRDVNGGYAEYMVVPEAFAFHIPEVFSDVEAAPLLCAGSVGYRSLRLTNLRNGENLGLSGFGASGHLVLKLVKHRFPDIMVFVFSRSEQERIFAHELGAAWVGNFEDTAPQKLDAIIDTTPAWKPVVEALGNLNAGGRLVINAIRKESLDKDFLLHLDYAHHLWLEKEIKSVANVTRQDVTDFLELAASIPIHPQVQEYAFEDANQALLELKQRNIHGAKVLRVV
jgi:alcohol dehydrogenase, propanol-preferring